MKHKNIATKIRSVDGFNGDAILYKVSPAIKYDEPFDDDDPPAKTTEYVIVSAVNAMFSGPETYIFPADENGEILDWCELDGSYRGELNHSSALSNAGYSEE